MVFHAYAKSLYNGLSKDPEFDKAQFEKLHADVSAFHSAAAEHFNALVKDFTGARLFGNPSDIELLLVRHRNESQLGSYSSLGREENGPTYLMIKSPNGSPDFATELVTAANNRNIPVRRANSYAFGDTRHDIVDVSPAIANQSPEKCPEIIFAALGAFARSKGHEDLAVPAEEASADMVARRTSLSSRDAYFPLNR